MDGYCEEMYIPGDSFYQQSTCTAVCLRDLLQLIESHILFTELTKRRKKKENRSLFFSVVQPASTF